MKIHIILLDGRFHYNQDKETDRFGELQYKWLEEILEYNKDTNVTLIMSGVQVLPDRFGTYFE